MAATTPGRARTIGALVLAGCAALLFVAAWLHPEAAGVGTHRQLGLAPCSMMILVGYPCPTCGMTTAFAHTVRGQVGSAFSAQPAGLFLAIATIVAMSISLSVVVTGKVWNVNWYRVTPLRMTLTIVLIVLGGWVYKLVAGVVAGKYPGHG